MHDVEYTPPIESGTHIVGECEMHKEERGALQAEMREVDECDVEELGTLLMDSNGKTIGILGDT